MIVCDGRVKLGWAGIDESPPANNMPPVLEWYYIGNTLTPKVCKTMAFMAVIMGLGLLFYLLLGFRYFSLGDLRGFNTDCLVFGAQSFGLLLKLCF